MDPTHRRAHAHTHPHIDKIDGTVRTLYKRPLIVLLVRYRWKSVFHAIEWRGANRAGHRTLSQHQLRDLADEPETTTLSATVNTVAAQETEAPGEQERQRSESREPADNSQHHANTVLPWRGCEKRPKDVNKVCDCELEAPQTQQPVDRPRPTRLQGN